MKVIKVRIDEGFRWDWHRVRDVVGDLCFHRAYKCFTGSVSPERILRLILIDNYKRLICE